MKEKAQEIMQGFSRAIIQPIMYMAVTGLIISVAAILKLDFMPSLIKEVGNGLFTILSGSAIGQLSVIFCVGIATAMAKNKKTDAAILGITVFMIFLYANNYWLTLTGNMAVPGEQGLFGTGQNMVLGVQVTDMGVFLGIFLGCLVGWFVNRFEHVKFHKYLSPYEGTKFAYMLLIFATIVFAIAITYIWPPINEVINTVVGSLRGMGSIGFFLYGFLNRMLLPIGMHHLLWMPLSYTPLGGTAVIAGQTYQGAINIWLAELGNISSITSIDSSVGYLANFGYTALPIGIALALIKTSKPENKARVKAVLLPAVLAALFAGITEPIEFLFLFISPLLWFVHAVIYGLGLFLSNVFGLNMFIDNVINTILYSLAVPIELGRQWLTPIIFMILLLLEYFSFVFLIKKFNIPTLGRGKMTDTDTIEENGSSKRSRGEKDNALSLIVDGLGGADNIKDINNCYSRLRIDVIDPKKVTVSTLEKYPSSGVINKEKHIQIVVGAQVQEVRENLEDYIKNTDKKGTTQVYSPANGTLIKLSDVPDEVFSTEMMGAGFAIKNHDGKIYAPVNGTIQSIFPTKHAISIELSNGAVVLIHMGIDTVELEGMPFEVYPAVGDTVTQGELIASMDNQFIKEKGKEEVVIVVTPEKKNGKVIATQSDVTSDTRIFEF